MLPVVQSLCSCCGWESHEQPNPNKQSKKKRRTVLLPILYELVIVYARSLPEGLEGQARGNYRDGGAGLHMTVAHELPEGSSLRNRSSSPARPAQVHSLKTALAWIPL